MESLGKRRGMSAVLSSIFSNRVTMLPGPHAYPIRARRLPHDESWVGNMLGLMIFHGARSGRCAAIPSPRRQCAARAPGCTALVAFGKIICQAPVNFPAVKPSPSNARSKHPNCRAPLSRHSGTFWRVCREVLGTREQHSSDSWNMFRTASASARVPRHVN
jgi:hypothetical protein